MSDRGCLKATIALTKICIHTRIAKQRKKALRLLVKGGSGKCQFMLYNHFNLNSLSTAAKLGHRGAQYTAGAMATSMDVRDKYHYRAASQGLNDSISRMYHNYRQDQQSEGISLLYLYLLVGQGTFLVSCSAHIRHWSLQQRCFILAVTSGLIDPREVLFGQDSRVSPELQRRSHTHLLTHINISGRPGLERDTYVNGISSYYISRLLCQRFFWD